jgi:hypothetical protein
MVFGDKLQSFLDHVISCFFKLILLEDFNAKFSEGMNSGYALFGFHLPVSGGISIKHQS